MHVTPAQLYHTLSIALTGLLLAAMGLFTFLLASHATTLSRESETYSRYNSCVLSVPALDRDINKIERCWDKVTKETGVDVKRYDK